MFFSDAFDFQYGVVILRLREGLDISHIQGQGRVQLSSSIETFNSNDKHISTCSVNPQLSNLHILIKNVIYLFTVCLFYLPAFKMNSVHVLFGGHDYKAACAV